MRIRKNAALVTKDERDRYIKAVKSLKKPTVETPHGKIISRYDQFVALHLGVTCRCRNGVQLSNGSHYGRALLPWHRQYILDYEDALRRKDSDLDLLYWDWADVKGTRDIIFHDDFMGSEGEVGHFSGYGPVRSGHFSKKEGWVLVEELHRSSVRLAKTQGDELLRNTQLDYSPRPSTQPLTELPPHLPNRKDLDDLVNDPRYRTYEAFLEGLVQGSHESLHVWLGGWVGGRVGGWGKWKSMSSPDDPAFFMHHTTVDWVWARWQVNDHWGPSYYPKNHRDPFGYGDSYGFGLLDAMWPWDYGDSPRVRTVPWLEDYLPSIPSISGDRVTPADVLDFRALGYTYDTLLPEIRVREASGKLVFSKLGDEHGFRLNVARPWSYRIEADRDVLVSLYGLNTWEPLPETDPGTEFNLEEGEYFVVARCRQEEGEGSFTILSEW